MTFCNHSAFGLRPFRKKTTTDFLCISKKQKKRLKNILTKPSKKHVKEFILSKAASFLCKTKT